MRLLIAGCGDLGTRLGHLWCAQGGSVVALRRRVDGLPACFKAVAVDLARPLPPGLLQGGFDAIAYLVSADARNVQAYQLAYVDGFRCLFEGVSSARARVVFASSTAVYGEDAGGWVDETSITQPTAFNGQILLRAEQQAHELAPQATVSRLSGLYGPGRESMLERARAGETGSARWGNRIHVDDAAGALLHVLRMPQPPSLLCVSDDAPARDDVVLAHLRRAMQLTAVGDEGAAKSCKPMSEHGRRVSNLRLRAGGFRLRHPSFVEGYAAVLGAVDSPGASGSEYVNGPWDQPAAAALL
ncbi:MAG: NAD-dependent epimerase/dehydratase family protein [Pseudomarimonas sp.]